MKINLEKVHRETWRLFITAQARLLELIDHDLKAAGKVPLHWYDVLIELYEAPDRRLRMHELAERVVLSRSGLTRLVDRLEKEQLLTREIDTNDRRGFYTLITEKGIDALRQAWPVYTEEIAKFFARHLTLEDIVSFNRVLTSILDSLRDQ